MPKWEKSGIPNFEKVSLKAKPVTQNLDGVTVVVLKILILQLKSFLVAVLTLSISKSMIAKTPNFEKTFFWSSLSITQYLELPSTAATFPELLSHNILFQKSCYFAATLPLHSYPYYLSVSN